MRSCAWSTHAALYMPCSPMSNFQIKLSAIMNPGKDMACETACGGIVKKLGTVQINGEADNQKDPIEFDHMRVRTPILSVRNMACDDHKIYLKRGGGSVNSTTSGKQIKFSEHAGVYYTKLETTPPVDSNKSDSGFGRQEA